MSDQHVVHPALLQAAQAQLADYIGRRVYPEFTDGLALRLSTVSSAQGADVVLSFSGPTVEANSPLLASQALVALSAHPALNDAFGVQRPEASVQSDAAALEIRLSGIPLAHTARLMQALAEDQRAFGLSAPTMSAHAAGCACSGCRSSMAKVHAAGCGCSGCRSVVPGTQIRAGQTLAFTSGNRGVLV